MPQSKRYHQNCSPALNAGVISGPLTDPTVQVGFHFIKPRAAALSERCDGDLLGRNQFKQRWFVLIAIASWNFETCFRHIEQITKKPSIFPGVCIVYFLVTFRSYFSISAQLLKHLRSDTLHNPTVKTLDMPLRFLWSDLLGVFWTHSGLWLTVNRGPQKRPPTSPRHSYQTHGLVFLS